MLRNFLFLILTLTMTITFTSCGSDNDGDGDVDLTEKDGNIDTQDDDDLDAADLQGTITNGADITLDAATEWTLTGSLFVAEGGKLRIEAGTVIKAVAGGTDVFLVVQQGGKIFANGTAANPIIMTSAADNPREGDWGGVVINGRATISEASGVSGTDAGTAVFEVNVAGTYGGSQNNDNSGEFTYVLIEYTGARINGEKEFNGLTMNALGKGTTINNIAVAYGDDDAYEFFGGTIDNVDNLLAINARDDMFDWTQGFTGGGSNWYGIRENGFTAISEDTRGIEGDGNLDGNSPTHINQSNVTVDKITIVNATGDPAIDFADMVKVRRGSNATLTNVMIALIDASGEGDYGTYSDLIDLTDTKGNASGASITFWYNTDLVASGADVADTKDGDGTSIMANSAASGADASVFSWTGYTLPTITAAN